MKKIYPFNWKERAIYNLYANPFMSRADADRIANDTVNAHKGRQKRRMKLFFNKLKFVYNINQQQ